MNEESSLEHDRTLPYSKDRKPSSYICKAVIEMECAFENRQGKVSYGKLNEMLAVKIENSNTKEMDKIKLANDFCKFVGKNYKGRQLRATEGNIDELWDIFVNPRPENKSEHIELPAPVPSLMPDVISVAESIKHNPVRELMISTDSIAEILIEMGQTKDAQAFYDYLLGRSYSKKFGVSEEDLVFELERFNRIHSERGREERSGMSA